MNRGILILAAAAVIGGVAIITAVNRKSARRTLSNVSYQQTANSSSGGLSRIQQPRIVAVAPQKAWANAENSTSAETNISNSAVRDAIVEEPLHDPIARVALSMVGEDPDAEEYWFEAINDLSLPAHEQIG